MDRREACYPFFQGSYASNMMNPEVHNCKTVAIHFFQSILTGPVLAETGQETAVLLWSINYYSRGSGHDDLACKYSISRLGAGRKIINLHIAWLACFLRAHNERARWNGIGNPSKNIIFDFSWQGMIRIRENGGKKILFMTSGSKARNKCSIICPLRGIKFI